MCVRFRFPSREEQEDLFRIHNLMEKYYPGQYKTGELGPGDKAPGFALGRSGGVGPLVASFGFSSSQGKGLVLNARTETAEEKPMFSEGFQLRRLVIPATGFYEWEHKNGRTGQKYFFQMAGEPLFYLCGLYRMEEEQAHFVILTQQANASMTIHDRMPLIARPRQVKDYLKNLDFARELMKKASPQLLQRPVIPAGGWQMSLLDLQ